MCSNNWMSQRIFIYFGKHPNMQRNAINSTRMFPAIRVADPGAAADAGAAAERSNIAFDSTFMCRL